MIYNISTEIMFEEDAVKNKDKEIARVCAYCEYGTPAPSDDKGNDIVIRSTRGPVKADGHCLRFKYDILKRDPKRRADLPEIEKIDI